MFGVVPCLLKSKLGKQNRHSINLICCVVISVRLASDKLWSIVYSILSQERKQRVFCLDKVIRIVLVVNNNGGNIQIPSGSESKIVPLNVAVEISMTGDILHGIKHILIKLGLLLITVITRALIDAKSSKTFSRPWVCSNLISSVLLHKILVMQVEARYNVIEGISDEVHCTLDKSLVV